MHSLILCGRTLGPGLLDGLSDELMTKAIRVQERGHIQYLLNCPSCKFEMNMLNLGHEFQINCNSCVNTLLPNSEIFKFSLLWF